jgi:hypothetical protein
MVERSSKLRRKIFVWIDVQAKFFPGLENVREREDQVRAQASTAEAIPGIPVSEIKLWLPSTVAAEAGEVRREVPFDATTYHHEYRLWVGQAEEALHEVRCLLLVRTHVYKLKDTHTRGVRANGRSQDKIAALNGQVQRAADQYRAARVALVALGGVLKLNEWEHSLKVLAVDDVCGLPAAKFHDPERKNKKRRRTKKAKKDRDRGASWIWVTQGEQYNPGNRAAMNEGTARSCFGCALIDNLIPLSVSTGRGYMHGPIDGARRWISSRPRWHGSPGFSSGGRSGGAAWWAAEHRLQLPNPRGKRCLLCAKL